VLYRIPDRRGRNANDELPTGFNASRQQGTDDLAAFRQTNGHSLAGSAEHRHTRATGVQAPVGLGNKPAVVNGKVVSDGQAQSTRQTKSISKLHIVFFLGKVLFLLSQYTRVGSLNAS
jgi:hypothetical protein